MNDNPDANASAAPAEIMPAISDPRVKATAADIFQRRQKVGEKSTRTE